MTPQDLADHLRRPVNWVRANAASLGGFKVGGTWRFDPEDIARYEARRKTADPLTLTPLSAARQANKRR
jgi:hypothetical protein